jgi:hypothetical protein
MVVREARSIEHGPNYQHFILFITTQVPASMVPVNPGFGVWAEIHRRFNIGLFHESVLSIFEKVILRPQCSSA